MTDSETPLTKPGDHLPALTFAECEGTLTTAEKWAELGVSKRTLANWRKAGKARPLGWAPGPPSLRWAPEEGDG